MNNTDFQIFFNKQKPRIDDRLVSYIKRLETPDRLQDAMLYSVQAGGKRLRPILLLAVMEAFGHDCTHGLPAACAIEMVHTYSLIHDDLPAMDNDDLRRGQPTNHKVFGEATAVLAGDALLTYSFEVIAMMEGNGVDDRTKTALVAGLARASGAEGMVGGQTSDLMAEGKQLTLQDLENIHLRKTGQLLSFSVEAGALLAGAGDEQMKRLNKFSRHLGLAFQIRDDILDVEGDTKQMGKASGSDESRQKSTYPQLLSLSGAKQKCSAHLDEAKQYLHHVQMDGTLLEQLADYIVHRNL